MTDTLPRRMRCRHLIAEDGSPVRSTCLPREAASVPVCRKLVRETLTDWKLPDALDAAELVASELASNAVHHARHGVFRLTVRRLASGGVRVAVTDKSRAQPVMTDASAEDLGGRGLALVNALSQQWGTDPLPWGKRVWADVDPAKDVALVTPGDDRRLFATPVAQIVYVLMVLALAAWLAVFIADGTP